MLKEKIKWTEIFTGKMVPGVYLKIKVGRKI